MDEVRQHPATYTLAALWILVYAAMTYQQGGFDKGKQWLDFGLISSQTARDFGALTASDVAAGQIQRTVLATFIHFSVLHMVMNMTCLISFGRVLESWYGGPQFFALYVAIAGLGNGLAVIGRYALGANLVVPCAGGSSVMFGLIAMIAVVGWRSKTRYGDYVRRQMMGQLIFFGVFVGFLLQGILDNFGHGGGAIAGAALGFTHRRLLQWEGRPAIARSLGLGAAAVLVACAVAQARLPRHRPLEDFQNVFNISAQVERLTLWQASQTRANGLPRQIPQAVVDQVHAQLARLDSAHPETYAFIDIGTYRRWRRLSYLAVERPLTPAELQEYDRLAARLASRLQAELVRRGLVTVAKKPR
jgi:membrane associated rhomboid family serine protease